MEAIESLHGLMKPGDDLLQRYFLGRLYHRLEMHEEALRTLEGIGGRVGRAPAYHRLLAHLYRKRGELDRGFAALESCVREGGLLTSEYLCTTCAEGAESWAPRCERCGAWGTLDVDFEAESPGDDGQGPAVIAGWNDWSRRDPATGAG